jgi:hypothetical protein
MRLWTLVSFLSALAGLSLTGCSRASAPPADLAMGPADLGSSCAAPPSASQCGIDGSWVRGIARFDPAHFAAGAQPILRVALRHNFVLVSGESTIGGRLHTWESIPIDDVSAGKIEFAIDMCGQGTAMWSEENGPYNLVLSIDENGNNDLDTATSNIDAVTIAKPDPGELTKMVGAVTVSCNGTPACLDLTLDCTAGTACTTFTPLTSCAKTTPGCMSDSALCK